MGRYPRRGLRVEKLLENLESFLRFRRIPDGTQPLFVEQSLRRSVKEKFFVKQNSSRFQQNINIGRVNLGFSFNILFIFSFTVYRNQNSNCFVYGKHSFLFIFSFKETRISIDSFITETLSSLVYFFLFTEIGVTY